MWFNDKTTLLDYFLSSFRDRKKWTEEIVEKNKKGNRRKWGKSKTEEIKISIPFPPFVASRAGPVLESWCYTCHFGCVLSSSGTHNNLYWNKSCKKWYSINSDLIACNQTNLSHSINKSVRTFVDQADLDQSVSLRFFSPESLIEKKKKKSEWKKHTKKHYSTDFMWAAISLITECKCQR